MVADYEYVHIPLENFIDIPETEQFFIKDLINTLKI